MYGHTKCFQYFAVKNNAALINLMCFFFFFLITEDVSSGEIPRGGIAGHKVNAYVVLLDIAGFLS